MTEAAERLYIEMKSSLERIGKQNDCPQQIEQCIYICEKFTHLLKKRVKEKGFACTKEEIYFFRSAKPRFVSLQTYYFLLYQYTLFKPDDQEERVKYLNRSLLKLGHFFIDQHWFYDYYQSGCSCLDHKYFLRTNAENFDSPGDGLISNLLAHQLFAQHICQELGRI